MDAKKFWDMPTFVSVLAAMIVALGLYGLSKHLLERTGKNFLGD